jgi:hypothetical protein
MKSKIVAATFIAMLVAQLLVTTSAHAIDAKEIVKEFDTIDETDNLSQLIRSNAPSFWAAMKNGFDLSSLDNFIGFKGVVAGDPHMGNFSVIPVKAIGGRRKMLFLNIDFDDAGRAPFVLDFARLVIAAEAANSDVKKRALESAYLLGLSGKEIDPPKQVRELLEMTVQDYDSLVDAYVDQKTDGKRFKFKDGALEDYKGKISRSAIANLFPDKKVFDVATRINSRGGNTGNRIWVLVENQKDRRTIIELKEYQIPGVASYERQLGVQQWLSEIRDVFWPGIDPESYDLVEIPGAGHYWVREKKISLINIPYSSDKAKKVEFLKELAVYDANILGLAHGRQASASGLRTMIEKDPDAFHNAVESVVKQYLKDARKALNQ